MLDHYKQCGILPVWELEGNETFCMVGNHSISVIAEAILKGIGDFDAELAFEAMKATSFNDRDGMGLYDKLGYMPADKVPSRSQNPLKSQLMTGQLPQLQKSLANLQMLNTSLNVPKVTDSISTRKPVL